MAAGAADARRIVAAVETSGVAFQSGYMWRYDDIANRLKRMMQQGAFGQLISVEMTFVTSDIARRGGGSLSVRSGSQRRGLFQLAGLPLARRAVLCDGPGGGRRDGPHRRLFGAVPTEVEDGGVAILDLEGGGIATFLGGYWLRGGPARAAGRFAAASGGSTGTPIARAPTASSKSTARSRSGTRWKRRSRPPRTKRPATAAVADDLLVQDWLDCIRTGRRDNRNTARAMLAALELIDAIFQSSREGRRIECRIGPN